VIIDTHTHFYDPTRSQGVPWPGPDNELLYRTVLPEHFRALAESEGVRGTVVVEASAWLEDNQWILDLAAADDFIVGLVGHVDPNRERFKDDIDRLAENSLLRGIRCGGGYFEDLEKGSFLADMAHLAAKDLQLDVLMPPPRLGQVAELARRLPELRIVINHCGLANTAGGDLDSGWLEAIGRAAEHPQVFMKVSAVMEQSAVEPASEELDFYRPMLDAMWDAFGEDRLVYGSNWPVSDRAGSFKAAISIVKAYFAEKGEEAGEKYFWKNAKMAYKWIER
jgi:L-fuconolactonase